MKSIKLKETIEEGIPFLSISIKSLPLKIAKKAGFQKKGKRWFMEKPSDFSELSSKLEKYGYRAVIDYKPVKPKSTNKVKRLLSVYEKRKKEMEEAEKRLKEIRAKLEKIVKKQGAKRKPGSDDSVLIVGDTRIHYCFVTGRRTWKGEEEGVKWLMKHGFKNCIRKAINRDAWDDLKKEGRIPVNVISKVERRADPSYRLFIRKVSELVCPNCGTDVSRRDKFCRECGNKLKGGLS